MTQKNKKKSRKNDDSYNSEVLEELGIFDEYDDKDNDEDYREPWRDVG